MADNIAREEFWDSLQKLIRSAHGGFGSNLDVASSIRYVVNNPATASKPETWAKSINDLLLLDKVAQTAQAWLNVGNIDVEFKELLSLLLKVPGLAARPWISPNLNYSMNKSCGTCRYIMVSGKNKGQKCPEQRCGISYFCRGCLVNGSKSRRDLVRRELDLAICDRRKQGIVPANSSRVSIVDLPVTSSRIHPPTITASVIYPPTIIPIPVNLNSPGPLELTKSRTHLEYCRSVCSHQDLIIVRLEAQVVQLTKEIEEVQSKFITATRQLRSELDVQSEIIRKQDEQHDEWRRLYDEVSKESEAQHAAEKEQLLTQIREHIAKT